MKNFFYKKWEMYQSHKELQKIIVNINWLFVDQVIRMALGFFVSIWAIRYLGPEKYGILSYVAALVAFFNVFSRLGLESIAVNEFLTSKIQKTKLLGTIFYMKLCGGMVAVPLASVTAFYLQRDLLIVFLTGVLSFVFIFQSTDVIDYWFQSRVMSKYVALSRIIASFLSAAVKFALIAVHAPLIFFAFVILLESIFVACGLCFAYFKKRSVKEKWIFDRIVARQLLRQSWPLIFTIISTVVYMRIDQIMIGNMLGYESLGNYTVIVNINETWNFAPIIIAISVFPLIIKSKKISKKLYYHRMQKMYNLVMVPAVIIAILMTLWGEWVINVLYGENYSDVVDIVYIFAWTNIFAFLGISSEKWFVIENLQKLLLKRTIFGVMLNVILNILFIPRYGLCGAAVATLISQSCVSYIFDILNTRTRILFWLKTKAIFAPLFFLSNVKKSQKVHT